MGRNDGDLEGSGDPRTFLRAVVTVLFVCALAGLVLTGVFGFEAPNDRLMLLSSSLLFAVLVAVLVHLGVTRALTRQQKGIWLRELTGRRAAWAWGEYLSCDDLRAAANRCAAEQKPARPGDGP